MIDELRLRENLQRLLRDTEIAIRERISDEPSIEAQLRERHAAAVRAGRTAGSATGYNAFADEAITQAAVHWLLACLFVRFLEDNGWLDTLHAKVAWIAGPDDRLGLAKANRTVFLRPDPALTDRDYLLHVFEEVAQLPGVAGLFDCRHNPLFQLAPTAQGAAKIVEFFQKTNPDTGALVHDFSDSEHRTRFLGDLYQNLSESARKRYALCQTPGFVVDFILDRTLTPALDAFGLELVRLIDPACGSGHFLLAAFVRLFRLWQQREPATNPPVLAQRALDAVYGVDLNPFAVEITRFRLLIAALEVSGVTRLRDALNFRFQIAAGDSLLHGSRPRDVGGVQTGLYEDRLQFFYATEDQDKVKEILGQTYHIVVGNPPYINVSDPVLREAYRERFATCHGKYQLGVPFTERFFDLTVWSRDPKAPAGWMGMIVSNAFMKRSFGKKLIENYLRHKDLTHVIDTSGVYLPGHNTPTAVLIGRNQPPVKSAVRAVLGIRGFVGIPDDPPQQPVWRAILEQLDEPGSESQWVSVADAPRSWFDNHPWSIGGGGAAELKQTLDDNCENKLKALATDIGPASFPGTDDAFVFDSACAERHSMDSSLLKGFFVGENVGDWSVLGGQVALTPYSSSLDLIDLSDLPLPIRKWLWPRRTSLQSVISFGNKTRRQLAEPWWSWYRWIKDRLNSPFSLVYAFKETLNKFTLDRGSRVFNRHAPMVKLSPTATESDYLPLLGLLNSSTGCFWLKQTCFPSGGDPVGREGARVRKLLWDVYYEFDSTKLKQFPIPDECPLALTELIQAEADAQCVVLPEKICAAGVPARAALNTARDKTAAHLARMIALQEELDWLCYRLYDIIDEDLIAPPDQVPPLQLGERAFEVRMAREGREPMWFERHRSRPITEAPAHWPEAYRKVHCRRLEVMQSNRDIGLIEQPEYKRRWNLPTWEEMEQAALKSWLLDRMEANAVWHEHVPASCARLRDALSRDANWTSVAEIFNGGPIDNLDELIMRLAVTEAVPFLPVLRYTETGLRKRAEWEQVWGLQRKEDAGEKVEIPVPTKYRSTDFQKSDHWRLRGGLDVPKERFILYPALERDADASPVLGWAGWNHLEQARALAGYYQRMRNEEGWEQERLKPILAGLLDLKPWLLQWHNELDPEMGVRLGEYFVQFAEGQCQELGFSPEDVRAWQRAAGSGRRARRRRSQ